jgi:hypothetical protein
MGGLFYEHTAGRLKRKLKGYKRKRKPIWNQRHRQRSEAKASEVAWRFWRCSFMSFCLFTYGLHMETQVYPLGRSASMLQFSFLSGEQES